MPGAAAHHRASSAAPSGRVPAGGAHVGLTASPGAQRPAERADGEARPVGAPQLRATEAQPHDIWWRRRGCAAGRAQETSVLEEEAALLRRRAARSVCWSASKHWLLLVAILIALSNPAMGLRCYTTRATKTPTLAMGETPITSSLECLKIDAVLETELQQKSSNEEDLTLENHALRAWLDTKCACPSSQNVNLGDTCFVSCEGPTKEQAQCSFGCTRYATCLMMVGMAERLAAQEKLAKSETLFYEFCVASGLCQDTQYWEARCCLDSDCNAGISTGAGVRTQPPALALLAVFAITVSSLAVAAP